MERGLSLFEREWWRLPDHLNGRVDRHRLRNRRPRSGDGAQLVVRAVVEMRWGLRWFGWVRRRRQGCARYR